MEFDVNKVCRVCLEEGVLTSVFSFDFGIMPCQMLMLCTKVKIQTSDGMPPHICNNCIYRLGVAYHFIKQCENSDFRLRQYLGLEFKHSFNFKDATTNTEPTIMKPPSPERKKIILKKRIRKSTSNKRKPEDKKLKRGPKPKSKPAQTCFECGKSFKCAAQLEMHIRTHTGERPFLCTYCPRRFAQKHNLSIHIRTHTGERPFQCEICSKQFSALGNFQSHKKIHTGIRDQICPVCNKAFISSGDLSRHMVVHTGIKNHHCDVCAKGFHRSRDMVAHKNKVHTARSGPTLPPVVPHPLVAAGGGAEEPPRPLQPPPPHIATPAARRPLHLFHQDTLTTHPSLINTHLQLNF